MQYSEYPEFDQYKKVYSYDEIYNYNDEDDICEICEISTPQYNCNRCANSICGGDDCSITFPHYCNTTYFVCMDCANIISQKLILQIDLGKLVLLKEKIRTGTTSNSVCSSRTNSVSRKSDSVSSTLNSPKSDSVSSTLSSSSQKSDSIYYIRNNDDSSNSITSSNSSDE